LIIHLKNQIQLNLFHSIFSRSFLSFFAEPLVSFLDDESMIDLFLILVPGAGA